MLWSVTAPFFPDARADESEVVWIDNFVKSDRHSFAKYRNKETLKDNWHGRKSRATPLLHWLNYWKWVRALFAEKSDGLITVFPQIAVMAGLQKRIFFSKKRIVAWCFNIGAKPNIIALYIAKFALKGVDRIVVHSTAEISVISNWFDYPENKIHFVHLQCADFSHSYNENKVDPFILSMGSANRDYATLFDALRKIRIRAVVVASPRSVAGLSIPNNVTLRSGLNFSECQRLMQEARLVVVPLMNSPTAAGQVTVIDALRMSRPVIASRVAGTVDYIDDGITGVLVEPGNSDNLAEALQTLWNDEFRRFNLAKKGKEFARQYLSDDAVAKKLTEILDRVA